jgi:Flp pilus assembly protein TadG
MFRSVKALGLGFWRSGALRRLLLDRRAAIAATAAIALPVVIGTAGFGVDVGYWYVTKRNFQGAADAAAYSAAVAYWVGETTAQATTEAQAVAAQHGVPNVAYNVTVNPNYTDAVCTSDCLEVVIQQTQPAMFASLVGLGNVTIAARSVAQLTHLTYCMLALDQANATGISIVDALGISTINMPNCSIGDNASGNTDAQPAMGLTAFLGILTLNAYSATVAGIEYPNCFLAVCNVTYSKPPKYDATAPFTPIVDPYASVSMPPPGTATTIIPITSVASCSPGTTIKSTTTLVPGSCYLGINISGSGTVVTAPAGNYTILASTSSQPAISVANGATLTMNAGNYQILGISGTAAPYKTTTNQPAISISGGTITMGNGTNTIQGGIKGGSPPSAPPAINVSGGSLTIGTAGGTTNNTVLGQGSGQPGIAVSGTGTMTIGSGTNAIQGGSGSAAISLSGTGHLVTLDGGTYVIGPPTPTTYGVVVNTGNPACGFAPVVSWLVCAGKDLALGAGTYTIMGGIDVEGGNLTLNANGTSTGTYILYGNVSGGTCTNVGLCMAFGDLNAQNSTMVLTGNSATGYATFASGNVVGNILGWGADGVNIIAPSTGTTSGIAIFQDRAAPASGSNTFAGLSFLNLQGALYFPAQNLSFVGSTIAVSNGGSSCYQLIANTVDIYTVIGITAFDDTGCPAAGATQITGLTLGLVE